MGICCKTTTKLRDTAKCMTHLGKTANGHKFASNNLNGRNDVSGRENNRGHEDMQKPESRTRTAGCEIAQQPLCAPHNMQNAQENLENQLRDKKNNGCWQHRNGEG